VPIKGSVVKNATGRLSWGERILVCALLVIGCGLFAVLVFMALSGCILGGWPGAISWVATNAFWFMAVREMNRER